MSDGQDRPKVKVLDVDQVRRLLRAAKLRRHKNARRDHTFLALVVDAGLRPGEAVTIRAGDLHLDGPDPSIVVNTLKRKRPTRDQVFLSQDVAKVLKGFTRGRGRASRLFPFTVRQAQRLFARYLDLAGLEVRASIKALRHTQGTFWAEASGGDIKSTADRLRHRKAVTAEIYIHLSAPRRRRIMGAIPPLT